MTSLILQIGHEEECGHLWSKWVFLIAKWIIPWKTHFFLLSNSNIFMTILFYFWFGKASLYSLSSHVFSHSTSVKCPGRGLKQLRSIQSYSVNRGGFTLWLLCGETPTLGIGGNYDISIFLPDSLSLVNRLRSSLWSQCGAFRTLHKAGCSLPLSLGKRRLVWTEDKCQNRRRAFQFLGPGVWAPWVPRCLQDVQKGRQAVPGLSSGVLMQALGW